MHKGIGTTHKLTIPYRVGGIIKGFKFRTIGTHSPKYLNSTGLDKSSGFFNLSPLKGEKDIVIVEGELDCLHATAKGMDNVVALAGSTISSEQIRDSLARGAKSFTLCFDRESANEMLTAKRISAAIKLLLSENASRIYVATLDSLGGNKTDPDSYIKQKGIDEFRIIIEKALPYYEFEFELIKSKYSHYLNQQVPFPRRLDEFLDEFIRYASGITDPLILDRLIRIFTQTMSIHQSGITMESLKAVIKSKRNN